ncbi:DUF1697 domain-containing protein [Streptomyces sp. NPDC000594]|uniref:DUF1697 domain-containing protein n=1 Tax=Streptomyces sp. NPDC000594 TaxID=3154261 RepID=UPI00331BC19D
MTTKRYAALLRGVNVGGRRKLPMAELRDLLTGLGYTGVATHLQSGNAFFTTGATDEAVLAQALEDAVERRFGFRAGCVVRDAAYLRAVVDGCPFPAAELEPRQLHVTYFSAPVTEGRFAAVDPARFAPEEFRLGDRALYLLAPDGLGRSALADTLARPALLKGLVATTRNWNTVRALADRTED